MNGVNVKVGDKGVAVSSPYGVRVGTSVGVFVRGVVVLDGVDEGVRVVDGVNVKVDKDVAVSSPCGVRVGAGVGVFVCSVIAPDGVNEGVRVVDGVADGKKIARVAVWVVVHVGIRVGDDVNVFVFVGVGTHLKIFILPFSTNHT